MKDLALWASDPLRYRIIAYGLLGLLGVFAVAGVASGRVDRMLSRRIGAALFLALAVLALFGGRWPTFFAKDTLNEDEAQAVAQAITALHSPAPWLGFDGNTVGPLNTYVLDFPALLGIPLTFFSARIMSVLVEFGAVAGLYISLALTLDKRTARLAIIPPVAFFALAQEAHYVHYSGEQMSLLFASLATACIAWIPRSRRPALAALCAGVFIGAMPFAKLQSAPIVIALAGLGGIVVAARAGSTRQKLVGIAAVVAGCVVVPIVFVGWTLGAGSFGDFWTSYVASALGYILFQEIPVGFLTESPEFGSYFDFCLAVAASGAIMLVIDRPARLARPAYVYLAALFILAATIDAIYAPRRGSLNYLLFAVVPVAGAAAASLAVVLAYVSKRRFSSVACGIFVVAALSFAPSSSLYADYAYRGSVADYYGAPPDGVTAMLERFVRPGDRVAIWGWRPQYLVYTQTLMGTRDSISHYQQTDVANPNLPYFRRRYIADMNRIAPKAFLDAGPDSFDLDKGVAGGHEEWPQLGALIRRDYHLVDTFKNFRLYLRDAPHA